MMDKRAYILKILYLYGSHGSICGRHKREGGAHYPGRSGSLPKEAIPVERQGEGRPEVSRGHSRSNQRDRRAEHEMPMHPRISWRSRTLTNDGGNPETLANQTGRNPGVARISGTSTSPATMEPMRQDTSALMDREHSSRGCWRRGIQGKPTNVS
jgi:hypothetical protein